MTTPSSRRPERRVYRVPALLLVLLLVAAAIWAGDDEGVTAAPDVDAGPVAADLGPVASPEGAASTWFCAGGTATPGGPADHVVTVSNPGTETVSGMLQVFPVRAEPAPPLPLEVAPGGSTSVRLGDIVVADYAAAQVEMESGPVVVHHEVSSAGGHDVARCATRASATWYLPWGQTTLGSTMRLALFNPFPGDAVVDVTFDTEDGFRRPEAFQAMLVRSRQLVVIDIDQVVTRRQRVSALVVARTGRLVVDRVQTLTSGDTTVAEVEGGSPGAADAWYFPEGRVDASVIEAFYILNPSDRTADVELTLVTGNNDPVTQPEPFQLRLAPGAASEVVLNREPRVAQPLQHATLVQASGDVPIVVERVLASGAFGAIIAPDLPPPTAETFPAGIAASLGSPLLGTQWFSGPVPDASSGGTSRLSVLNPGGEGEVEVRVTGPDGAPLAEPTTLGPGRRLEVPVSGLAVVEADGPIVVGQVWLFASPTSFALEPSVPGRDGVSVARPVTSFGGETLPDDASSTVVPATTGPASTVSPPPSTTAPG